MGKMRQKRLGLAVWAVCGLSLLAAGCHGAQLCPTGAGDDLPRELVKVSLPPYVVEPPDILLIDALRVIPLPPHRLEPFDEVLIQFPASPSGLSKDDLEALQRAGRTVGGIYVIEPEGTVNLGPGIGSVSVAGLTTEEAQVAVVRRLERIVRKEIVETGLVSVTLAQSRGMQQIRGPHLVRPDGTISLGLYGAVHVAGMTLDEVKAVIEEQLSRFLLRPEISVDVSGYNSKVYYVVIDLAGAGQQVIRLPVTGNETVLDAIGQINGLPPLASKHLIWLARPSPGHVGCDQVMRVDWQAITQCGATATNYQVLPGDRIYVKAQPLVTIDNTLAKVFSPIERIFGITLLGSATVHSVSVPLGQTGGGGGGF
jgi:polysaccharide export outer membrane protein